MKNISAKMKKFEETMDAWSKSMDEWVDSFDETKGEEIYTHTVHTVNGHTTVENDSSRPHQKKQRMSYVDKADLAEMIDMQVERSIQKHMNGVYVWLIVSLSASFTALIIALCAIY